MLHFNYYLVQLFHVNEGTATFKPKAPIYTNNLQGFNCFSLGIHGIKMLKDLFSDIHIF